MAQKKWIAAGTGGATAVSDNGTAWVAGPTIPSTGSVVSVGRNATVIVASGGNGEVATSPDGLTWTARTAHTGDPLYGITWNGSKFYAGAFASGVRTSPDGITWTALGSPANVVAFTIGSLGYVAAGPGLVRTSPDGITWTDRAAGSSNYRGVCMSPTMAVVVGLAGAIRTSTDLVTWTSRTAGSTNYRAVAYGNGVFVAVGDGGVIRTSVDGVTWTARTSNVSSSYNIFGVAFASGLFVASGDDGGGIITSPDGITWTKRATPAVEYTAFSGLTNSAPNAPAWTTADGQTVDVAADSALLWAFSDPDIGDSQSQFVLDRWALDSGGARVGSAVRVVQSTPVTAYTIPAGSLAAGDYEFKVATRDALGVPASDADLVFSASLFQTFKAKPGAPTITAPAASATVAVSETLTWSTPSQDAYQVQVLDGATVVSDTGEVTDGVTRSLVLAFPDNNATRTIRVRRKLGGLWSDWATVTVTVSWTAPADPTAVKTPVPANAAIDLTITNPAPSGGEPTVSYNDVYYAEPGEAEGRRATHLAPNSTWRHWLPASDAVYTYRIVAVATNGTTSEVTVS